MAETKLVAKARGLSSLRFVVFPYNIEVLPREEVRALAEKACQEIVSLLTQGAPVKAQAATSS